MAWTPPSDAVEMQVNPATVGLTGWTPPSDALEVKATAAKKPVTPTREIPTLGSPMGDDFGSAIMAAAAEQAAIKKPNAERKAYTGSVFDTTEPEFNPEEAARLSRRAYAERKGEPSRRTQYMKATPSEQIERTPGQAAADVAIGLLQGAVGIPKGIASNVLAGDNPVAQFFEEASKAGERSKSPFLQSQKAGREALLQNVGRNQGELAQTRAAFSSMFSPAGVDVMAQGAGSMIPTMGMSLIGLGQKAMIATNALANAGDAAQATAEKLSQMSPQEWSNSSAYQELRATGIPHGDAVKILTPMFALPSQVVGGIVGGVSGATGLEKTLAGKAIKGGARERASRAGAELLGEQLETLAPSLTGNITQRLIDEKKSLLEGLGREAIETAFGSTPGAAIAASGRAGKEAPKEIDTRGLAERMARERGFLRGEQELKPAVEEVPKPKPTEAQRIEPTFETEPVAPEFTKEQPPAITQERTKEQADILELEALLQQLRNPQKTAAEPVKPKEAPAVAEENLEPKAPIAAEEVEPKRAEEPVAEEALVKQEPSAAMVEYGLPQFFSSDQKESDRIYGLMKSGPLKTRIALSEANDSVKKLASTIRAAGFDVTDLPSEKTPQGILKIRSQIENIAARASRLANAAEAVQKKHKRASQALVKTGVSDLMSDVKDAEELIAEEPNVPTAAEQMEGAEVPASPEVSDLLEKQRKANADIEAMSKRSAGTSLMKVLGGSLNDSEMSELAGKARKIGKNPFISLVAKKGTPGSSMEDMVDSGRLDLFLPEEMRPGRPAYDNAESAEYIREKLRANEFYTEDTRQDMEMIQRGIWDIEKEIQEELTLDEINREIQFAVNEQREIDQQAAPVAAEGEAAPLEVRARAEEELLKTQTEKELRAKQDEVSRLEKENKKLKKEAEEKAKADEQVGEFVLTGSKREADEAAARGQQTLFSTAPPKAPPTESAAFKKWFGDSKVVDADGKPLVMYHGTNKTEGGKAFTSFDTYGSNYGLMGLGAYFTADPEVASSYTEKGKGESPTVYPVYLSIKNPIDMDAEADPAMWKSQFDGIEEYHEGGKTNESWYRAAEDLLRDQQIPGWEGAEMMQDGLRNMGFDGVTHIGGGRVKGDGTRHRVFIAFDPTQIKSATGNVGTYDPENTDIRYQRSTAGGKSIGKQQTQSITDAVKSKWANAPEVVVAENMADPAIPEAVRAHNKEAIEKGAKGSPKGFFYKGKAYILADAMTSPNDVVETLFHESLGHYGLRGTFGPEMGKVLADIVKNRRTDVEAKAEQYGFDPKNPDDMLEAAEEVLAEMAQTKPGLTFVKRAISAIRNFLRDLGLPFKMSNEDIVQKYILPARAFVESGERRAIEGKPSAMRGPVDTEAQEEVPGKKKYFSKPVDETWLFGRDKSGRIGFGPGAKAYAAVADITNKVLDKFSLKPISPELGRAIRNMKTRVDQVQNKIGEVASEMKNLSTEERVMISDIIEGELKAGIHPPQHVLNLAATIQSIMTRQSEELVDLGMLSKEAANRWDNKYLPRFYETKLRDEVNAWAKATKDLFKKQPMMRGIKGSQLRARGIFEVIDAKDLQDYINLGWEQRDPEFDSKSSEATIVWRDYNREERENMKEIRDAMFRFVMGYNASQRDIALGRLYKDLAENYASKFPLEGYVRVPDTEAEGTKTKKYGKLAGLYVPKEIMDHLSANDEAMASGIAKLYRAGLSKWKEGKTVLNPVSHANNVISNVTMAHFAGVGYLDAHKYAGAIKDLVTRSDMVKEAKDVGVFGGTFNQEELVKSMPSELKAMANMTESRLANFGERIWDTLAFTISSKGKKYGARPVMQWAYEGEDMFFRYLIYRDARNRGMSPEDARDYSQEYIFTYDDLPKGARAVRDYGMPFFSYTYKVIPVLARTALQYPWRFAAPATVAYAANALMYSIAASMGGNDDDWWASLLYRYATDEEFRKKANDIESEERKHLPEWIKGHSGILATPKAIRMGMDEVTGLPLFLDISRIFPGGDLLDANNNAGGVSLLQPLTPSNPILTTLTAMLANKDMFSGKDVVKETDTDAERAQKRAAWLWKQASPAIAVGNYHFDRAMSTIANMTGEPITIDAGPMGVVSYTGIGRDGLPVQPKHALLQTMGIKIRPYDLELATRIEESKKKQIIRELDMDITRINRQEEKKSISSGAAKIERDKLLKKKEYISTGLTVGGEEKK